ncbi:helix-turn-helix domain-containing protein [Cohnella cholangitidis]|uniref:helix-turn-helix domain-containing protein n=1 Tax=Cohnella cholangitidis TaxID=2598458 RepID=UPI0038993B29
MLLLFDYYLVIITLESEGDTIHLNNRDKISLVDARKKFNFTIEDVSNHIGIPCKELINYELNPDITPCSVVYKLCKLYGISADQIM